MKVKFLLSSALILILLLPSIFGYSYLTRNSFGKYTEVGYLNDILFINVTNVTETYPSIYFYELFWKNSTDDIWRSDFVFDLNGSVWLDVNETFNNSIYNVNVTIQVAVNNSDNFYDSFNRPNNDTVGHGWQCKEVGGGYTGIYNNMLLFNISNEPTTFSAQCIQHFHNPTNITFSYMTNATDRYNFFSLYGNKDGLNKTMIDVRIDNNEMVWYDGTDLLKIMDVVDLTWYNISIIPDYSAEDYDIYVNGVLKNTSIAFLNSTNATYFYFRQQKDAPGGAYDITSYVDNFYMYNSTSWQVTEHTQTVELTQGLPPDWKIWLFDLYDNSNVMNFTIWGYNWDTCGDLMILGWCNPWNQTTTTGEVNYIYNESTSYTKLIIDSDSYPLRQLTIINQSWEDGLNTSSYWHNATVISKELNNLQHIQNFSVIMGLNFSTSNGELSVYPRNQTTYFNWSSPEGYGEIWGLSFNDTMSLQNRTYNLTGLFNIVFDVKDNVTNVDIAPRCFLDGYNLSNHNQYWGTRYTTDKTIECSLVGYQNYTYDATDVLSFNGQIKMEPAWLSVIFDANTSGSIQWENTTNGFDGYEFNNTDILDVMYNMSMGHVTIIWNNGQQIYQFYNDQSTSLSLYLHVIDVDLIQPVKTWDGITAVQSYVTWYKLINKTFRACGRMSTDSNGDLRLAVKDANVYKFVAEADDYVPISEVHSILPNSEYISTDTILLTFDSSDSDFDDVVITNDCTSRLYYSTSCNLTAIPTFGVSNFLFNYSNQIENSSSLISDPVSATFMFDVTNQTKGYKIDLFIDSVYWGTYTVQWGDQDPENLDIQVGFVTSDRNWIYDYIVWFILFSILSAVVIGMFIESKFQGWGFRASIVFLTCLGYLVPFYYAIGIIYFLWFAYDSFKGIGGAT